MKQCAKCAAAMPDHAKFCGKCGAEILNDISLKCKMCGRDMKPEDRFCLACGYESSQKQASANPEPARPSPVWQSYQYSPPAGNSPQMTKYPENPTPTPQYYPPQAGRVCRTCNSALGPNQQVCPYCGSRVIEYDRKDRSGLAGGLIIAAAVLNLLIYGMAFTGFIFFGGTGSSLDDIFGILMIILVALNIFAIWGGIQALNRRKFGICMISAVLTIFGILFFISIIAIVLLAVSRDAFNDSKQQNTTQGFNFR
jgi:RNA polymerase subunit RPABC4/transcription elongation factor Spt4